jgi:hypothetical protein
MQDIKQNIDFPMNLLFRSNDIGMNLKSTPAPVKLQNREQNGCMCRFVFWDIGECGTGCAIAPGL